MSIRESAIKMRQWLSKWLSAKGRREGLIGLLTVCLFQVVIALPGSNCTIGDQHVLLKYYLLPTAVFLLTPYPLSAAASAAAMLFLLIPVNIDTCFGNDPLSGVANMFFMIYIGIPISFCAGALTFCILILRARRSKRTSA